MVDLLVDEQNITNDLDRSLINCHLATTKNLVSGCVAFLFYITEHFSFSFSGIL